MKFKVLLLVAPFLSLSGQLFAWAPLDSIGVENLNGKKVVLHKLDPKDNYYSVSRRYNVTPGSIILFNNNAPLKIGSVIKVPTEQPFSAPAVQPVVSQSAAVAPKSASVVAQNAPVVSQATPSTATAEAELQQYKVSAGETLYSIAKRFNTTVEDIVKLNNLPSSNAAAGQLLKIKLNSATPPPPVVPVAPPIIAERDGVVYNNAQDSMNAVKFGANKFGLFEKAEKGIAVSMVEEGLDPSKKLALHRSAPIGTVIKITNPMTGKTTFAKVVGRFTDSESTKDAIIVVTKNVSDSIGALDKRVQVNISYGSPNE
jgi:LysM repeat protein